MDVRTSALRRCRSQSLDTSEAVAMRPTRDRAWDELEANTAQRRPDCEAPTARVFTRGPTIDRPRVVVAYREHSAQDDQRHQARVGRREAWMRAADAALGAAEISADALLSREPEALHHLSGLVLLESLADQWRNQGVFAFPHLPAEFAGADARHLTALAPLHVRAVDLSALAGSRLDGLIEELRGRLVGKVPPPSADTALAESLWRAMTAILYTGRRKQAEMMEIIWPEVSCIAEDYVEPSSAYLVQSPL